MKISHYQNITGEKGEDKKRKNSHYWNEGKWDHFIKPLLPTENRKDMTLVDIGANNGLFCKLAKDEGFRDVIGIESDLEAVQRGNKWKEKNKYDFKLLQRTIGESFNIEAMPVADVYLFSNVHYYFQLKDWLNLLDRLITKTEYVLIITRPFTKGNRKDWRPLTDIDSIKHYFKDWELVRARYKARPKHAEYKQDPSPRVLHSMLFRSKIRRKKFDDLIPGAVADEIKIDRKEFITEIDAGIEIQQTKYYKAWKKRMFPKHWDEEKLMDFCREKLSLMASMKFVGMTEPIIISGDHKIIDGKHRCEILKAMNYQSVMTRMI